MACVQKPGASRNHVLVVAGAVGAIHLMAEQQVQVALPGEVKTVPGRRTPYHCRIRPMAHGKQGNEVYLG